MSIYHIHNFNIVDQIGINQRKFGVRGRKKGHQKDYHYGVGIHLSLRYIVDVNGFLSHDIES